MKKIVQRIYAYFTAPILEEFAKKRNEARKEHTKRLQGKSRISKYDYKEQCLLLNKIEKSLEQECDGKLKKWNWLKKLID